MIDYTLILNYKYPEAEWVLDGEVYDGLKWLSESPKPSKATLDALWDEAKDFHAQKIQAKIDARESRRVKLLALGLTEEELDA